MSKFQLYIFYDTRLGIENTHANKQTNICVCVFVFLSACWVKVTQNNKKRKKNRDSERVSEWIETEFSKYLHVSSTFAVEEWWDQRGKGGGLGEEDRKREKGNE